MKGKRSLVIHATQDHDEGLRRLLRETPLQGRLAVSLEREPSFFHEGMETVVAVVDGRVIACGTRRVRRAIWRGNSVDVAYLSDLRVHPDYQNRSGRVLLDGYRLLAENANRRPVPITWTAVFEKNLIAMRTLGRNRRSIPHYVDRGGLRSAMIWCCSSNKWPSHSGCRRAVEADRSDLVVFLQRHFVKMALAPVFTPEDLRMEDFILIRENGVLVAAMAVADLRATQQIRIVSLPWELQMLRTLMKWLSPLFPFSILPSVGELMPLAYASFMAVADNNALLTNVLLRAARVVAFQSSLRFLCTTFHEDDPRLGGLKGLLATAVKGRLFQVMLSGNSDDWTDEIPHIEAAWL